MHPESYWVLTCGLLIPATAYASWIDYKERRVPNWLNAAIAAMGILVQGVFFGWSGVGTALSGMLIGFGVLIVPWLMHGMGAGDVKLMAAIGAWFGPVMTVTAFCSGALIGGVIAVIMIVASGKLWMAYANCGTILTKMSRTETMFSEFGSAKSFGETSSLLPYGVPLTIGSVLILVGQTLTWWAL
jgi:prepilin peptidase CpaA